MSNTDAKTSLSAIRLVVFDVDGVFTDGRFYLSNDGIESKSFNTQDGYGVRRLLETGIEVAIISGRSSAAVEQRMAELDVRHVIQGCRDKVGAFDKLSSALGISAAARLDDNDGHGFFEALGVHVVTGPTLTNVNDFRAILIA